MAKCAACPRIGRSATRRSPGDGRSRTWITALTGPLMSEPCQSMASHLRIEDESLVLVTAIRRTGPGRHCCGPGRSAVGGGRRHSRAELGSSSTPARTAAHASGRTDRDSGLLRDDATRFAEKAASAGVDVTLEICQDMPRGFPVMGLEGDIDSGAVHVAGLSERVVGVVSASRCCAGA